MVIDNKGKLPLHLVGQSASQKNRGKRDDIIKLLKSKMPEDDDEGEWAMQKDGITAEQSDYGTPPRVIFHSGVTAVEPSIKLGDLQ